VAVPVQARRTTLYPLVGFLFGWACLAATVLCAILVRGSSVAGFDAHLMGGGGIFRYCAPIAARDSSARGSGGRLGLSVPWMKVMAVCVRLGLSLHSSGLWCGAGGDARRLSHGCVPTLGPHASEGRAAGERPAPCATRRQRHVSLVQPCLEACGFGAEARVAGGSVHEAGRTVSIKSAVC
jgi:hypothetical protein